LHVDLTSGKLTVERPEEAFYRQYFGGSAMGLYYLLHKTPIGTEPLSPDNTLALMGSVLTGLPVSGQSRVTATARSPETDLVGDAQGGGFWPAELKYAGFDGVVFRGRSERPVYLWLHDGDAELREAAHLWGRFTADVEDSIRGDLGDQRIHVLQCGPAAERGVRFSALISLACRANGRTGMGLVMASKNLKAVAVRGRNKPVAADPGVIHELVRWGADNLASSDVAGLALLGTAGVVTSQNRAGGLPTRNWSSGVFEGAKDIGGQKLYDTVLKERDTCYACVVRCKRVVEITSGPYQVNPRYGGPEYETLATLGSYCGISDLAAVCYANQLCNMYGMDTIACGATIAWAMDCFEHGLLSPEQTGGLDLRFGNAEAMVTMVQMIGERQGLGHVLGEGSSRAAEVLGIGRELVVAVKNHELPAHMPQVKRSLALIYGVNPFGADHQSSEHDDSYRAYPERMAELGLHQPQPERSLNREMVRYAFVTQCLYSFLDSADLCQFVWGPSWHLYGPGQIVQLVRAATGWDVNIAELLQIGERRLNMMRAFNAREGAGAETDRLPPKLREPLQGGPSDGVAVTQEEFDAARAEYYRVAGWDATGRPTRRKLEELALGWVADDLGLD
jgi:aldehyde:ferredoxin oxidoreductase